MEEQRIFASFINVFVYFIPKHWFARFLKTFLPKLSATRTLRLCRSLCLRHLREVVCFHLRVLPLSVCLLYVVGLIYHSIFRKNHKKAPEAIDASEAEFACATMSGYKLMFIRKRQSRQSRNEDTRLCQRFRGLST